MILFQGAFVAIKNDQRIWFYNSLGWHENNARHKGRVNAIKNIFFVKMRIWLSIE